jgi:DNA-binding protein HU-beta
MNREALIDRMAQKAGVPKRTAEAVLGSFTDSVQEAVASGDKVTLVGFGTFEPRKRPSRTGRNPRTGERLNIAERTVPVFSAGKGFRERVGSR